MDVKPRLSLTHALRLFLALAAVLALTGLPGLAHADKQAPEVRRLDENLWVGANDVYLLLKAGEPPTFHREHVVLKTCAGRAETAFSGDCLRYFDTGQPAGTNVSFKKVPERNSRWPGFMLAGMLNIDGQPGHALWARAWLPENSDRLGPTHAFYNREERYPLRDDFRIRFPDNFENAPALCCSVWISTRHNPVPSWSRIYFLDLARLGPLNDPQLRFEGTNGVEQWPGTHMAYVTWGSAIAVIDTRNGELLSKNPLVRSLPTAELAEIERAVGARLFPAGLLTEPGAGLIAIDDDYQGPSPEGFSIVLDNRWNADQIVEGDPKLGRRWLNEVQRLLAERFK